MRICFFVTMMPSTEDRSGILIDEASRVLFSSLRNMVYGIRSEFPSARHRESMAPWSPKR
jgi:hypothetical protein